MLSSGSWLIAFGCSGSLPFLCALALTTVVSERLEKQHKTVGIGGYHIVNLIRLRLPDCAITLRDETASRVLGLHANAQHVTLVTAGQLDAMLHEPPPGSTLCFLASPAL